MSQRFCSLIVLGPGAPSTFKLHLSRGALVILVLAFLISFFVAIWVGFNVPPPVIETHRTTLEAENQALKLETANAVIGIQKLDAKVTELEDLSKRIDDLMAE